MIKTMLNNIIIAVRATRYIVLVIIWIYRCPWCYIELSTYGLQSFIGKVLLVPFRQRDNLPQLHTVRIVFTSSSMRKKCNNKENWSSNLSEHQNRVIYTLKPRQICLHLADGIFKCILLNENIWISRTTSLKFVPKVRISNILALVQIKARRRRGDKPLSETGMVSLLTHLCVSRPQ